MKEDLYLTLIHKHLSGDISREEQSQLDQWLAESPDHKMIADHIRRTWKLSGNFSEPIDLNLDREFAQMQKKLSPSAPPISPKTTAKEAQLSPRRPWLSIAAGIAILIIAAFAIRQFRSPQVEMLVVKTAAKETKTVQLPDGSTISLNQSSELRYPSSFKGQERAIEMIGEAYFEVTANPENPFVISTPSSVVTVLGTVFSVNDYKAGPTIYVTVKEGKVNLHPKGKQKSITLQANEKGTYMKNSQKFIQEENKHQNEMSWYTHKLVFEQAPLGEVFSAIQKLYGPQIYVSQSGILSRCLFTGTFDRKDFDSVLETIQLTFGFEVEKIVQGASYRLKGGSCD